MNALRWTLLADGGSDRALRPILRWCLRGARPDALLFEPRFEIRKASAPLEAELRRALRETDPDILFVHRDAERESRETRWAEIPAVDDRQVRVIPVRMTEAWLLIDERAIRAAASNPNGRVALELPRLRDLERDPDPKESLRQLLLQASELQGRRLAAFKADIARRCCLVAEEIEDFAPLRNLPAFRAFLAEMGAVLDARP
jgi:hypothetical protein